MRFKNAYGIIGIAVVILSIVGFALWKLQLREDFIKALARGNTARADELWEKGARFPARHPYSKFMRIKEKIGKEPNVEIHRWYFRNLTTFGNTNRYVGALMIKDPNAEFGVNLVWNGEKWEFKPDYAEIPLYVRSVVKEVER